MKLSIITISFNNAGTIVDTIRSVQSQTCRDIEYIIVDGASKDGTVEVISAHIDGNTRFVSEKDQGIYDALNKGIRMAQGDIIGFLHADDIFYDEHCLLKIQDFFRKTNADVVYGNLVYVTKDNTDHVVRMWNSGGFRAGKLKFGWMPPHPTFYCRKTVFQKHGEFNLAYKIAADYDFMMRVLKDRALQVAYLSEVLVRMRVGGASNKSLKNILNKSQEDYSIIRANKIGGVVTLICKNLRKIPQFIFKYKQPGCGTLCSEDKF